MKTNPVIVGILVALGIAVVYFAYRAGQQNPQASFPGGAQAEFDRLRTEYQDATDRYDGDLKELRADFNQRVRELEQTVYALREQLARAGVDIKPIAPSSSPGPRNDSGGAAAAPAGPIAKETFYQLRGNMSVQDVERVLGRPGELNYRMGETDGTSTENYRWSWMNPDGSEGRVTVTFKNNRLSDKEYWGEAR